MSRLTIGNVCSHFVDCVNRTAPETPGGGYYAVGTPAMRGNIISMSEVRELDFETFQRWTRRLVPEEGDLLVAREAPVGPVVRVPAGDVWAAGQRTTHLRVNSELINPKYFYYLLISPVVQRRLLSRAMGSTVEHLRVGDVRDFVLPTLPNRASQDAIAELLGALDDKIAANERVVAIADQMAISVLEANLVNENTTLGELAQVTMGTSPSGETFNEHGEGEPFFQGVRDFGARVPLVRIWTTKPVRMASAGEILLSVRAPVGRLNRAHNDLAIGRGLAAVRALNGQNNLLYYRLRVAEGEWLSFSGDGTLFSSVNRKQIESIKVRNLIGESEDQIAHTIDSLELRLRSALAESAILASTRDELLPLLMSGKITVKDAEKVVSDAV